MRYLITGGCGFIGSNLAAEVLHQGHELIIFDNLFRHGSSQNLNWLKNKGDFAYYPFDIRNYNDVETVIKNEKPDVIFHLAGQVAMTTSISNPRLDFEVNTLGTHNLIEAVRKYRPYAIVLYSSTNKVYGDFSYLSFEETKTRYLCKEYPNGFNEDLKLEFHSPYGCSKGAADQYLLDYSRIYDIQTVVFRHSSMYGGNQNSTIDQGWVGWFIDKALEIKSGRATEKFTISGNGKQVRDVLHVDDVVRLYFSTIDRVKYAKGNAFNIGGGITNSLSILELFNLLEQLMDINMEFVQIPFRSSDQLVFVADNSKANTILNWKCQINSLDGVKKALNWASSR